MLRRESLIYFYTELTTSSKTICTNLLYVASASVTDTAPVRSTEWWVTSTLEP